MCGYGGPVPTFVRLTAIVKEPAALLRSRARKTRSAARFCVILSHLPGFTEYNNEKMRLPFVTVLAEAVMLAASHTLAAKTFETFWKKVSPKLSEGVAYVDSHEGDVLKADKTFLEIITLRDPEMTRIVNACLKDFLKGPASDAVERITQMENKLTARKERINTWKLGLMSAPASSLLPLRVTRKTLENRIVREKKAVSDDEAAIARVKTETLKAFSDAGVPITAEQLDGLIYSAEGGDVARVMAAAENIRTIEKELGRLLAGGDATCEQAKSYTGFLMMSYRVYLEAIERALHAIEKTYLVRLNTIKQSAGEQMMLADQLMSKARKVSSAAKNNRDINAKTIELAELYEGHLMNRLAELKRLHREMQINFELAVNTFRTIKVGGELIDVMKTSERDLKSIFEFDAPQFSAFYDKTLRAEFATMTQKIRAQ